MSESKTKQKFNTNPLDGKVAENAEAEMNAPPPAVDSEAPTREMPPEMRPIAGGMTSPMDASPSGPVVAPTTGAYLPPQPYNPNPYAQYPEQPPVWQPQVDPHTAAYPARQTDSITSGKLGGAASIGLKPNFAAMIAYTPFIGFIAALLLVITEPERNRFVRFHAKQALIGHIAFWAITTALRLGISNAPMPIPVFLWFPQIVLYLGYFIGFIFAMAKSYNSERFKIPIIGDQAE